MRPTEIIGEGMTDDQALAADRMPTVEVSADTLVMPSGQSVREYANARGITVDNPHSTRRDLRTGSIPAEANSPEQRKSDIVNAMQLQASVYIDRSLWYYPAAGNDGPEQFGLAYSYGQKDPTVRARPPAGDCTERLHGLDCSGFVFRSAAAAGIAIPSGPAGTIGLADVWNVALPTGWGLTVTEVRDGSLESGDIISWGGHIGIIGAKGSNLVVLQSNGRANDGTTRECSRNYGERRGPRAIALEVALRPSPVGWGLPNAVLRLRARAHIQDAETGDGDAGANVSDAADMRIDAATTTGDAARGADIDAAVEPPDAEIEGDASAADSGVSDAMVSADANLPPDLGAALDGDASPSLDVPEVGDYGTNADGGLFADAGGPDSGTMDAGSGVFWQGTVSRTTCSAPGSIGAGDICGYAVFPPLGSSAFTGGIFARTGTSDTLNVRQEYSAGRQSHCRSRTIALSSTTTAFTWDDDFFWGGCSTGTQSIVVRMSSQTAFAVDSRTATTMNGTFVTTFTYMLDQLCPPTMGMGTATGTWFMSQRQTSFPKCTVTAGEEFCSPSGFSYPSSQTGPVVFSCDWRSASQSGRPGEWLGLP